MCVCARVCVRACVCVYMNISTSHIGLTVTKFNFLYCFIYDLLISQKHFVYLITVISIPFICVLLLKHQYDWETSTAYSCTVINPILLVCNPNLTPIVMAKHWGSCVHFSGISTCGRTSRETVSHPQCPPLPTLCKISLPIYVIVTNKLLQP